MLTSTREARAAAGTFRGFFPGQRLVLVTNREPYEHVWRGTTWYLRRPAGGVTAGLDPILQAIGGVWVAWGSGSADAKVADEKQTVWVPADAPRYLLQRVRLSEEEVKRYYLGYANTGLWPLANLFLEWARFRREDWRAYAAVNRRFAEAAATWAQPNDVVWIHDYHLALVPAFLKKLKPDVNVSYFWHIAWPPPEVFRLCPQRREVLGGILAADVVGFQVEDFTERFLRTVAQELEAEVNWVDQTVSYNGHISQIRTAGISVDFQWYTEHAGRPETLRRVCRLRRSLGLEGQLVGLGVDRLDHTKGLLHRLAGIRAFFYRFPEYLGRFTFLQVAVPSRSELAPYRKLRDEVEEAVREINKHCSTDSWRPVRLVRRGLTAPTLVALYRLADVLVVTSLSDGMNLVAKEYVASQVENGGALLLSQVAGAAQELADAWPLNPLDPGDLATAMNAALQEPRELKLARMARMRETVARHDVYKWAQDWFSAVKAAAYQ